MRKDADITNTNALYTLGQSVQEDFSRWIRNTYVTEPAIFYQSFDPTGVEEIWTLSAWTEQWNGLMLAFLEMDQKFTSGFYPRMPEEVTQTGREPRRRTSGRASALQDSITKTANDPLWREEFTASTLGEKEKQRLSKTDLIKDQAPDTPTEEEIPDTHELLKETEVLQTPAVNEPDPEDFGGKGSKKETAAHLLSPQEETQAVPNLPDITKIRQGSTDKEYRSMQAPRKETTAETPSTLPEQELPRVNPSIAPEREQKSRAESQNLTPVKGLREFAGLFTEADAASKAQQTAASPSSARRKTPVHIQEISTPASPQQEDLPYTGDDHRMLPSEQKKEPQYNQPEEPLVFRGFEEKEEPPLDTEAIIEALTGHLKREYRRYYGH